METSRPVSVEIVIGEVRCRVVRSVLSSDSLVI